MPLCIGCRHIFWLLWLIVVTILLALTMWVLANLILDLYKKDLYVHETNQTALNITQSGNY